MELPPSPFRKKTPFFKDRILYVLGDIVSKAEQNGHAYLVNKYL